MKRHVLFLVLILIALLSGFGLQCALNIAGDVTETGNSSIVSGIVVDESNVPIAGVEVVVFKISADSFRPPVAVDTVFTRNDGSFKIELGPAVYILEMKDDNNNVVAMTHSFKKEVSAPVNLGPTVLEAYVSYEGIVKCIDATPLRVILGQTLYETTVDTNGVFIIQAVPRRQYPVLVEAWDSVKAMKEIMPTKNVDLSMGPLLRPDTVFVNLSVIVLDDFEDGNNFNKLGPIFGRGWWDARNDVYAGGNSNILQPITASPIEFKNAIKSGGAGHEKGLQVLYSLGDTIGIEREFSFVYVGMEIGGDLYDLSGFDSLCFYVKGNGKVLFEFVQFSSDLNIKVSANVLFTLSSMWQRCTVTPADLSIVILHFPPDPTVYTPEQYISKKVPPYTKGPTTWEEMGGVVNMINFLGIDGNEFWLDDIKLYGVNLNDMIIGAEK